MGHQWLEASHEHCRGEGEARRLIAASTTEGDHGVL